MSNSSSGNENFFFDRQGKFHFIFGFMSGIAVMGFLLSIILFIMFFMGVRSTTQDYNNDIDNQVVVGDNLNDPTGGAPEEPEFVDVRPIDATDNVKGPKNATVELIEYSDFECPFCGNFYGTLNQIAAEYGDKIRIAFRHFPLSFHAEAQKAAEASECAGEQGKFWEMHDKIFEAQNTANFNIAGWKKFAGELKLNANKFNDCLDSGKFAKRVQDHLTEGSSLGVSGTPTAFVNGRAIRGALPYAQVKAMVEAALQK